MDWIKTAKPGDKVVCVKDDFDFVAQDGKLYTQVERPKLNQILTISSIQLLTWTITEKIGLQFAEIAPIQSAGWQLLEVTFDPANFRPLESRPTDISVFTDMLNKVTEDA